jgi:hypothetical protein
MGAGALGHADQALSTSATARLAVRRRQGVAARSAESVAVLIVVFAVVGGVLGARESMACGTSGDGCSRGLRGSGRLFAVCCASVAYFADQTLLSLASASCE